MKFVLKYTDSLDDEISLRYQWLLCDSLTSAFFCLVLKNALHLGLYDLVFRTDFNHDSSARRTVSHCKNECAKDNNIRGHRVSFAMFFLLSTFSFLAIPNHGLNGRELLGGCFGVLLWLFILAVVEKRYFEDDLRRPEEEAEEQLDFLNRPTFEQEVTRMRELWRGGVSERNPKVREEFDAEIEKRKEQLAHMLSYMRAHSNYLQEKILRTHVERSKPEKVQNFLQQLKELRDLTSLIEENFYFLFSQHTGTILPMVSPMRSTSAGEILSNLAKRTITQDSPSAQNLLQTIRERKDLEDAASDIESGAGGEADRDEEMEILENGQMKMNNNMEDL